MEHVDRRGFFRGVLSSLTVVLCPLPVPAVPWWEGVVLIEPAPDASLLAMLAAQDPGPPGIHDWYTDG